MERIHLTWHTEAMVVRIASCLVRFTAVAIIITRASPSCLAFTGPGTAALLNRPQGVCSDFAGGMLVADTGNMVGSSIGGAASAQPPSSHSVADSATAPLERHNIHCSRGPWHRRIKRFWIGRRFASQGFVTPESSRSLAALCTFSTPAATATQLNTPTGIVATGAGVFFVADRLNHVVRR